MQFPEFVDLTCRRVTELAGPYMANSDLTIAQRARFEQHLHACTWCMTYVQQLGQTARAAARLTDAPTPDTAHLLALFRKASRTAAPSDAVVAQVATPPREEAEQPASAVPVRIAFKFLARGAIGPLSGHAWEKPTSARAGGWLGVEGSLIPCRRGVHACRADELAHWLHDELWLIELASPVTEGVDVLVARRGRLVGEVTEWSAGGASRFAAAARDHAAEAVTAVAASHEEALACLQAARHFCTAGDVAMTAYCAAMAVARMVGVTRFDQQAFEQERCWQSAWIASALDLGARRVEAERALSD